MQLGQELPNPAVMQKNSATRILGGHDSRADNNSRTVHFEKDRIVIMRRVSGVSMRVTMPVSKYAGIGVVLPNARETNPAFQVNLVHADPDLSVTLYKSDNPLMVDAAVSEWSRFFELPVFDCAVHTEASGSADALAGSVHGDIIERTDAASESMGALAIGNARKVRRRGAVLSKRRPRLYSRRKSGDGQRMEAVYASEREIIARN